MNTGLGREHMLSFEDLFKRIWRMEGAWRYLLPFSFYIFAGDIARFLFKDLDAYQVYIGYIIRTIVVGIILIRSIHKYPELSKKYRVFDGTAVLFGVVIFLLWVALEGRYPILIKPEAHYDPTNFSVSTKTVLILIRLIGSVLVAPLIEELFMRSFLMRIIINQKWENVSIGTYSLESFVVVTLFFGFSHYRWLPGLLTGALLNILVYKKRNLYPTIFAHGTANLFLFIYVLMKGAWFYY
jgi:CAAX prenyl protease-like protein